MPLRYAYPGGHEAGLRGCPLWDSINLAFPDSKTRRGRVGKDRAGTLETSCNQGTRLRGAA